MQGYKLVPFPGSVSEESPRLEVRAIARGVRQQGLGQGLELVFRLKESVPGALGDVVGIPQGVNLNPSQTQRLSATRADRLWEETCFECFLLTGEGDAYLEFNATADGRWNLYGFDSYRKGMRAVQVSPGQEPLLQKSAMVTRGVYELSWFIPLELLPFLTPETNLGLSMVLEERHEGQSYWAIQHLRSEADFHALESFVGFPINWNI
jgi:hypothetical protein